MIAGTNAREEFTGQGWKVPLPAVSDGVDSFDDDLAWIVERLMHRVGGAFGLISRYLEGGTHSPMRVCGGISGAASEPFLDRVSRTARSGVDTNLCDRDGAVLRQFSCTHTGDDPYQGSWRMLCLGFRPVENVELIACVCRANGEVAFTAEQEQTARGLYPVLVRYLRLWWLHRTERRRANALSTALDLSDAGIVMLNRRGELLFANTQARSLLEKEDGVGIRGARVTAADASDGARLQAAIQCAIETNLFGRPVNGAKRPSLLSLRRKNGQRPLIATVTSAGRPAVDPRDPAVVFYLVNPEQNTRQLLVPVCELYKLTAVESQLVDHLVAGLRLSEAAAAMHIQAETARTYLKQIFSKTATNRQADLIRLMLASAIRANIKADMNANPAKADPAPV